MVKQWMKAAAKSAAERSGRKDQLSAAYSAWATHGRRQQLLLDYPFEPVPRWGHGRPSHPLLMDRMAQARSGAMHRLEALLDGSADLLGAIPQTGSRDDLNPNWGNGFLPTVDASLLMAFLIGERPTRYVEVGSGNSTKFARAAIEHHGLATAITSIDNSPRAECDDLCDTVIRTTLQDASPLVFEELQAGDIVFFDGSHRTFQSSDVTVFFLDLLPRLQPGVIVHVHDIFLPDDYPPQWKERWYSEQYVVAAILLYDRGAHGVLAASHDLERHLGDAPAIRRLHEISGDDVTGASLWLRTPELVAPPG
jgi:hypothetical protein